jgi:hypothetical protein
MKSSENESTPQGTRVYRGMVTFRYKKYRPAILVGFSGISHGLVSNFRERLKSKNQLFGEVIQRDYSINL